MTEARKGRTKGIKNRNNYGEGSEVENPNGTFSRWVVIDGRRYKRTGKDRTAVRAKIADLRRQLATGEYEAPTAKHARDQRSKPLMAASLADPTDDRRLHDLYRMYDIAGRLLYVGVTNGGLRRFMEHSKDKTWWREVDSIKVEHAHCTRSVIEWMERDAIVAESPLYNVAHNHGIAPQTACVAVSRPLATPAGSWSASGLIARVATAPDGQREILETLIVQQLGERGPLSRNMLLSAVRDGGAKIGSTPFTDAVNIMVLKGAVSETNGPRGAKVIAVIGQAVAA